MWQVDVAHLEQLARLRGQLHGPTLLSNLGQEAGFKIGCVMGIPAVLMRKTMIKPDKASTLGYPIFKPTGLLLETRQQA